MPNVMPPSQYTGHPNRYALSRGSCLWRVHRRPYCARVFNSRLSDPLFGGGRFDSTSADPYPYCYVGLEDTTALSETLLRDLEPDETGQRVLSTGPGRNARSPA